MRLSSALATLAGIFLGCSVGFVHQLPAQQPSKSGISRMFLDAHSPSIPATYSRSEIKQMIRDAKTPEEFERLADYFDYRAMEFEEKSEQQEAELQRLLALPYHARSYPSQVDSTRELIKRYKAQAKEYSSQADVYRGRTSDQ